MAIDKEVKKKVIEEWLSTFPQLSAFAQNKLYKVVGRDRVNKISIL